MSQRRVACGRQDPGEILDQRIHAAHHLHTVGAAEPDLIQRQPQKIVPRRKGNDQPKRALLVAVVANFQSVAAKANQQVLDLIQRLHRGGRVVDGRRKRFDSDIHQQPERVFWVLLERAFIADLKGATICVVKGTTSEQNLADYFRAHGWTCQPLVLESVAEIRDALVSGRCQAYTSDASQLASVRMEVPEGTKRYTILPDLISKEPLGPVVRRGDEEWFTLVRWVLLALIQAEELGITRENVRALRDTSTDAAVQRLLGKTGGFGKALGVDNDWVVRVVGTVGNYGEIFERNLGRESVLNLERGLNRLWTQGGLMYAPPFR